MAASDMFIGINAMQVRAAKSGVGQYIHALFDSATRLAPEDQFLIYCNEANELNYTYDTANASTKVWGLSGAPRPVRLSNEYLRFGNEVKRAEVDVLHGASNFLPMRKVCPYVVSIHDLSYYVHPERCPPVRRQYWYAMTRHSVKAADRIITISENSRRDIARFFPGSESKIRITALAAHSRFKPIGLDRQESLLTQYEDKLKSQPYVLYVGTLEPGKNVARIVQAFDAVASKFPDHLLVLAGDKGWLYESVFDTIENAAHRNRIVYLGHVSDMEAVHLFNFADAFVFPSLYEGFGLPPLEAMQCGCPVVTSNRSSIPEVVGDAAIMVNPESVTEISTAMRRLLESKVARQEFSQAGLERARLFSWDKCAAETLAVYREVAG